MINDSHGLVKKSIVFRFYQGSIKKVTSTGYAEVLFDANGKRVFFVESNSTDGYKAIKNNTNISDTSYIHIAGSRFSVDLSPFAGNYDLLYSKQDSMYYIDLTKAKR